MKNRYRALRRELGTQEKIANQLGISRQTINRRESGKCKVKWEHWQALWNLKITQKFNQKKVKLTILDPKRGMLVQDVNLNQLLEKSNSGICYLEDCNVFSTRDKNLFKELIADEMAKDL